MGTTWQAHRPTIMGTRHVVPAIYPSQEWAEAGRLMSYGSSFTEQFHQAGVYRGRVLKDQKPADLLILRATRFSSS